MKYFIEPIKNYAAFTGRATRQQYWMFTLIYILFYIATIILDVALGLFDEETGYGLFSMVYTIGLLLPYLALLARRLHDIGRSAWWILLIVIPLIGPIVILIFTVIGSQQEENKWGPNPHTETAEEAA